MLLRRTSWRTSETGAKLYFSSRTLYWTLYWENECLWLQLPNLVLLGKITKLKNVSHQQISNCIPLPKYVGLFPSDYVTTLDNDTFAIVNTQLSKLQGAHSIIIAKCCQKMYFTDALGRPNFLKRQYKQMMPEPPQTHSSVWNCYTIYSASHLFKFRQEVITGVQDVYALSFMSNYK